MPRYTIDYNSDLHISNLEEKIDAIISLYSSAHTITSESIEYIMADPNIDISSLNIQMSDENLSKQIRGLIIVLLFASYENLIKSLTKSILEAASRCKVSYKRLTPQFQHYAISSNAQGIRNCEKSNLHKEKIPKLVQTINSGVGGWSINPGAFPDDGSFMKKSQIEVWWSSFHLSGDPSTVLGRTWSNLGWVVMSRNKIAHGEDVPENIGKQKSPNDVLSLIRDWEQDWKNFIQTVDQQVNTVDFYRIPR